MDTDLKNEIGQYEVTFSTINGLSITRRIWVVDQRVVENKKANEAVSAFNFFKTVDEIKESMALDTDLKTWANAQGWKLDNEDEKVDLSVDYNFDPDTIKGRDLSGDVLDNWPGIKDPYDRFCGGRQRGRTLLPA